MNTKGFTENTENIETPNDINITEKPLKNKKITRNRVDIKILVDVCKTFRTKVGRWCSPWGGLQEAQLTWR